VLRQCRISARFGASRSHPGRVKPKLTHKYNEVRLSQLGGMPSAGLPEQSSERTPIRASRGGMPVVPAKLVDQLFEVSGQRPEADNVGSLSGPKGAAFP
jgi:hypothetical protein